MKHIRFIGNNQPVCTTPDQLGEDFIVVDFAPEDETSCGVCLQLVTVHNKREYEREGLLSIIQHLEPKPKYDHPLSAAKGVLFGAALGSGFWIGVIIALWFLWCR